MLEVYAREHAPLTGTAVTRLGLESAYDSKRNHHRRLAGVGAADGPRVRGAVVEFTGLRRSRSRCSSRTVAVSVPPVGLSSFPRVRIRTAAAAIHRAPAIQGEAE